MLVLSRKLNESICIGNDIRVMISQIGNGRVKLAISAPADIAIRRGELVVEEKLVRALPVSNLSVAAATLTLAK